MLLTSASSGDEAIGLSNIEGREEYVLSRQAIKFHKDGEADWSISRESINLIHKFADGRKSTLETGAGFSTITFAASGSRHICVSPNEDEIQKIRDFCSQRQISLDNVTFVTGNSERVLPGLELPALDFVLIDGGHGFPVPAIDWFYTAGALKLGGVLAIDDIQLWSCQTLVQFLKKEPEWRYLGHVGHRTAVFKKVGAFGYKEHSDQRYVIEKSRLGTLLTKARRTVDLICAGDFAELRYRWQKSRGK
jgi:predicted O-methyltransferase YrrM